MKHNHDAEWWHWHGLALLLLWLWWRTSRFTRHPDLTSESGLVRTHQKTFILPVRPFLLPESEEASEPNHNSIQQTYLRRRWVWHPQIQLLLRNIERYEHGCASKDFSSLFEINVALVYQKQLPIYVSWFRLVFCLVII